MVEEMQVLNPAAPWLNGVVLGRMLHRVLAPLLTWHGGRQANWYPPTHTLVIAETTLYRFPEVQKARLGFERFIDAERNWQNDLDQWQVTASYLLEMENLNPASRVYAPVLLTFDLRNALQEF